MLRASLVVICLPLLLLAPHRKPTRGVLCWNYENPLDRHPTVRREFGNSQAVLVGRVASVDSLPETDSTLDAVVYHVLVLERFKGPAARTLPFFSENSSGRFPLDRGVTYLLFGHRDEPGLFYVNNCGNSGPADSVASALTAVRSLARNSRRRPPN